MITTCFLGAGRAIERVPTWPDLGIADRHETRHAWLCTTDSDPSLARQPDETL
jgi:hypothetical protein